MVECACKFDDWGVVADILHYREYDKEFNTINVKIKDSSWMPPLLSKIIPYVNSGLKH
jgi:hypothetical protein